jgi:hypothetical protein
MGQDKEIEKPEEQLSDEDIEAVVGGTGQNSAMNGIAFGETRYS